MKKKRNKVVVLLVAAVFLCNTSYAEDSVVKANEHTHHDMASHGHQHHGLNKMELPAEAPSSESLYNLTSTWTSSQNKQVQLSEFKGKPVVIFMAYTSCEFSCPIIVGLAKRIEAKLGDLANHTSFVFVSFDGLRDTPERLDAYARKTDLDYTRWSLLHGAADDIRELAIILGVAFKEDPKGVFSHSNVITVLNQNGEIAHRQIGLTTEIEQAVGAVKKILPEKISN